MWWMVGNREAVQADASWLERIIVKHIWRVVLICFLTAVALFIAFFMTRDLLLLALSILLTLLSIFFIIYSLVRKTLVKSLRRRAFQEQALNESSDKDYVSRDEIVSRWRHRAQQKEMDEAIERAKRGR
jgi:thiol:disulfide interchange protein